MFRRKTDVPDHTKWYNKLRDLVKKGELVEVIVANQDIDVESEIDVPGYELMIYRMTRSEYPLSATEPPDDLSKVIFLISPIHREASHRRPALGPDRLWLQDRKVATLLKLRFG